MVVREGEDLADRVPSVDGFVDLVLIGHGGSSAVYAATQVALQRRVALKVLHDVADRTRRLEREARALGALSGAPHIVQVHDVVTTADGHAVLVMPLLEESLTARVRRDGPQPLAAVARWATQLALGLQAAHRRGIAHRDIKPENVLLSVEGDAYLVDFGIAGLEEMESGTITVASVSPPHAPPERFTDEEVDERAGDIYSLGSTLYFALCGRPAFGTMADGGSLGLMRRISGDPLPGLDGLDPAAHAAIARAMAKRPQDRYLDVTDLAAALEAAAEPGAATSGPARSTGTGPPATPGLPPPLPPWVTTGPHASSPPAFRTGGDVPADQDHTVVKASLGAPSGSGEASARPRRRIGTGPKVLLVAGVACIGLLIGFAVFSLGDDSVHAGTTSTQRTDPAAETVRIRSDFGPLSDLKARALIANRSIYSGPDRSASYDRIIPEIDGKVLPLVDQGLAIIDAAKSSDPGVQAGIDAYRNCWRSMRAFFVEEKDAGWDRVPVEPIETYDARRNDADQAADRAAQQVYETACSNPAIRKLAGK